MGDASTSQIFTYPHLQVTPGGQRLIVNGKPFLILGAELQNSSFSCPEFMQQVWPNLRDSGVNTVLANVCWETIEPEEGSFDFTRLDRNIYDARRHGLHIILLWFGGFKNAKSTYAPSWVKTNATRFPRAMLRTAEPRPKMADALSIFSAEAAKADATAFAVLMRHIREIDERHSTVLMVQVENEVGLLGSSRDVSDEANKHFYRPVPQDLLTKLSGAWDFLHPTLQKTLEPFRQNLDLASTSWPETFGEGVGTDELFMAYHFASYVEQVARAGKHQYQLPLFTNVWQNYADEDADKSLPVVVGGGGQPGDYPSGGAVINVLDIWQFYAPSLNFIAPDVYLNDYNAVCQKYLHRNQPLFIPEQRRDEYGARRIWSAYGTYMALCASPFGIDSMRPEENPWKWHFGLLSQISHYLLAAQEKPNSTFGFFFDELEEGQESADTILTRLGDWDLKIERAFVFGKPGPGYGMVIHLGAARFMLVGEGFQVRFTSAKEGALLTGILSFVEKVSQPGTTELKNGRILNGDETGAGEVLRMPNKNLDLGTFPICVTIPPRTRIAECEIYALF